MCVLRHVYLDVLICWCSSVYAKVWLFGVCQGVAVLMFALCVLWVGGAHSCVQRDICALDAVLLPSLVRGSSRG